MGVERPAPEEAIPGTWRRGARARRLLMPVLALIVVTAAGGCASIPDSGPVQVVEDVQPKGQQDPHVRVFAQPPQGNEEPVTIVDGFLEALTSDEAGFDTARQYLTKRAQESWQPGAGTFVFNRPASPLTQDGDTVRLNADEVARIDASGRYEASPPKTRFDREFQLVQVKGQWRIAGVPPGVFLSRFDFQRLYRPLNAYFFDPTRRFLVPDPLYVRSQPGQLATLVRSLLSGPGPLLGAAVVSAFPPGTSLVDDRVPIEGGVPHVRLNAAALAAPVEARDFMVAQLLYTVRQLGYTQMRITAEGGDFAAGSTPDTRSVQQYSKFEPDSSAFSPIGHYLQNGKLIRLFGQPAPVLGAFGTGRGQYRSFAVSYTNDQIAAVTADGRRLYVGSVADRAQAAYRLSGTSLSRPSYDALGRIWILDRTPSGSRLWMVPERGAPQRVSAEVRLRSAQVTDLRISRDGTRVAVLIDMGGNGTLWVGRAEPRPVESDGSESGQHMSVDGLRRIAEPIVNVLDVSWSGPGQLTLLGEDAQQVLLPYTINFDGSGLAAGQGVSGRVLVSIAAADGQPLLAATSDGSVRQLNRDGRLIRLGKGSMPIYPG